MEQNRSQQAQQENSFASPDAGDAFVGQQARRGNTSMAQQIDNNFVYHPPKDDQQERYVEIREQARELAHRINELTPPSREQSLALTKLEEAVMWANAAIARNE